MLSAWWWDAPVQAFAATNVHAESGKTFHGCNINQLYVGVLQLNTRSVLCLQDRTEVTPPRSADLHKDAVEAYLELSAARQAEKDSMRQHMLAPADAAVNFAPAVGEPQPCPDCVSG